MRPLETMPEAMRAAYTMGGRIPVEDRYHDDTRSEPLVLTEEAIDAEAEKIAAGRSVGYSYTTRELRRAFKRWPIRGQRVALVGCVRPDYPGLCIAFGARHVTIVDRNRITADHPKVEAIIPGEYGGLPFDSVVSLSMVDHAGLGRYGDPLAPDGDLWAMGQLASMLRPGGLLYLGVTVGMDRILWNKGRIFGEIRIPLLLRGWTPVFVPTAHEQMARPNRSPEVIALFVLKRSEA